ncbi:olfactory receptor 6M1-like [Pseudophryne corroboree]|uniref:olfactory receptor 6M1-like n=1 Tax=Pseudophryne corroboree TaxID=495146 RepID=UPI003081EDEB
MENHSIVNEFVFTAFPKSFGLEILFFILFLILYIIIILGNVIIIILTLWDTHLQLPMYFFLGNISFLEMSISTVVIPNLLVILLSYRKTISFVGCFVQCYLYFALGTTDFILLAVMSFDRYVAICNPLQYVVIMNWNTSFYLALASWMGGFLIVLTPAVIKAMLPYCKSNEINHFFCDSFNMMKLVCIDTTLLQLFDFFMYSLVIVGSLSITIWSYTIIAITIYRIPSVTGRHKAFSTCVSHLFLVSLGYGGTIFIYVIPKGIYYLKLNKFISLITIFVTPILSPFIFSLRNQAVQNAFMNIYFKVK